MLILYINEYDVIMFDFYSLYSLYVYVKKKLIV